MTLKLVINSKNFFSLLCYSAEIVVVWFFCKEEQDFASMMSVSLCVHFLVLFRDPLISCPT